MVKDKDVSNDNKTNDDVKNYNITSYVMYMT